MTIKCACGCGTDIPACDAKGRTRKIVPGHHLESTEETLRRHFWARVKKDEGRGCWEWTGAIGKTHGYGTFCNRFGPSAHRASWRFNRGEIPEGVCVLHHCDNRICVRPDHLYLGTKADNNRDAYTRNRRKLGESHPRSKFKNSDVISIRERVKAGEFISHIAKEYGVWPNSIWQIINGKTWRQVK